ncbi:hypothetical protein, partial [Flavobacterium sp.]|uniref:hypothetical protein n=1 Tax=Flavobacterium sp. TaxID=239 RepID=UPI00391A69E5
MKTKLIYYLFVSMFFGVFQISAQDCLGFTTYSMGGWGTECHGGNPGCYRDANFEAAFPDGIRIGNETNSITLTTSQAVADFLPSGSTPRALNSGALVNPGNDYRNGLAGQLVALTLSVGFDAYDVNFSSNTQSLASLVITSGTFAGMTVGDFLILANSAIGGEVTGYSFSEFNSAAAAINLNFHEGTADNGFLTCDPCPNCERFDFTIVSTNLLCFGESTGTITLSTSGGTAPYSYYLNNVLVLTTDSPSYTFTGLAAGSYIVTVNDSAENSGSSDPSIVITQTVGALSLTTASTDASCQVPTGTATVTASGGTAPYTILWSNGSIDFSLANLAAGTYTAVVTDANGCQMTTSVTVQNTSLFQVSTVVNNVLCFGANNGSITVTASNGISPYTILWSDGSTSFTLNNLLAGTYTAVVTDAAGCTVNILETITEPTSLLSSTYVSSNATCCTGNNGIANVTPSGGTAPYTILWSNGSTDFSLNNLIGGNYTYVITDATGCQTNGSVLVQAVPTLTSTYQATAANCDVNDGTVTVTATGGTAPYTILWSNGSTAFALDTLAGGIYSYTITDANGCQTNGSVIIALPADCNRFDFIITSTNILCYGQLTGTITLSTSGGTAPYAYFLNNVLVTTTDSPSYTFTGLAAGSYVVMVNDSDENSGSSDPVVQITQPSELVSTVTHTDTNCNIFNGTATVTATGGTSPYTILWSNGSTDFTIANLAAGTYTYNVTDANGCQTQGSVTITGLSTLVATITATNVSCFGGTTGSATVTASSGTAPYTILWSTGSTSFTLNNLLAGTYTAVVTDANGCTVNVSTTITQPATLLSSTFVPTNATCCTGDNGTIIVTPIGGTAPYTILWSNGSAAFLLTALTGGTYTYVITDANGCIVNGSVIILSVPVLASTYVVTPATCAGNNAQVTVTATGGTLPYAILWSNGSTSFTNSNLASGTYTYTVTDANGCQVNGTVTIVNSPVLVATTTQTNVSCFAGNNGSVTVTATGGTSPYTILWSNGGTTFTANNLIAGTYTAVITDSRGCTSNVSVTITQPATALASTNTTTNVSCFAGNNGSVTVTATGGTSPYTILWSNGGTT